MNKQLRMLLSLLMACVMCVGVLPMGHAESTPEQELDQKIYESLDIYEKITFDDDSLVVVEVLYHHSGIDKTFTPKDFPEVEVAEVQYQTPLLDPNRSYEGLKTDQFRQSLLLKLKAPGHDNVLAASVALMDNPMVRRAFPLVIETFPEYSVGDVNNDWNTTAADALLVLQYTVGKIELSYYQMCCANFRNTGYVTVVTALDILQLATGKTAT